MEKKEIDHRLLPNEDYEETYKKDEKPSEKNIEENGKKYNIKYYKIYKINSKDKSQKREYTNYEIIDEKNEIGLKEIFEAKLINKDAENEYYQNYKKIYKVDENGKETYIKEEKVGEVYPKKIKTITEYDIIGLSLEEIDNKRKEKSYPIQFKRVYYEKELNTENPLKNETGKTEEVSINIQHFTEEIDKENLEEFDKEFLIVEGIAIKDFEKEPKRNVVKKKIIKEFIEKNNQSYIKYYTIDENNTKTFYKEKQLIPKKEGITDEQIEKKKKSKYYPIRYKIVYYEEDATKPENKLDKVDSISIELKHVNEIVKKGDFHFLEEYDVEVYIVNGKEKEANNKEKLNYKQQRLLKQVVNREEEIRKGKEEKSKFHLFSKNEHTFVIEHRFKLSYDDGSIEYTDWCFKKFETYEYD